MFANNVCTGTPRHDVFSFDHFVTQWMSTVTSSYGSFMKSSHVQDVLSPFSVVMVNFHRSSGILGVGPADSTGNPSVRYCPGGRSGREERRCPPNPGVMMLIADQ